MVFGRAYYWKEFCVLEWVGLALKQLKTLRLQPKTGTPNSLRAYIREGLLSEGVFASVIWRLIFRMAYFLGGLLLEFYGMSEKHFRNNEIKTFP